MNPAELPENLGARTEQKMIGVREKDPGTRRPKRLDGLALYGRLRSDGHKNGSFDFTVKSCKGRGAGP